VKIVAILTSHDRRRETMACLRSFFSKRVEDVVELEAVLIDDGCSDGTGEAVRELGKPVAVARSVNDLFWAAGMALAEERALQADPDYLLSLNDDVVLDPDASERLHALAVESGNVSVVVGALRDPETGEVTYSGFNRHRLHPLRFDRVESAERPVTVDTFNGNVVLVPRAVSSKVGRIDGEFVHGLADFDDGA
jgi:GT2 family glycosyltransferase